MEVSEMIENNSISVREKHSLLIVDDSDYVRERLVAMCEEIGNIGTVLQAKNSEQAYNQFRLSSPDIIILDIQIPGDNGIKILENIRSKNKVVKIIILTNYPYDQYKKRCLELGANYFFDKSDDMNKIFDICEGILNKN